MSLTFYYGSGSPYAWKVWLVLEHKAIPYEFRLLSFDGGDTKTPAVPCRQSPRPGAGHPR